MKASEIKKQGVVESASGYKIKDEVIGKGINPADIGNWKKVKALSFDGEIVSESIDVTGSSKIMVRASASTSGSGLSFYINGDTSQSNYDRAYENSSSAGGNATSSNGIIAMHGSITSGSSSTIELTKVESGGTVALSMWGGNQSYPVIRTDYFRWKQDDDLSTLDFHSFGTEYTGKLEVFEWQDMKASTLASYELVKEYDVSGAFTDTIEIDAEVGDEFKIVSTCTAGRADMVFDGDTSSSYHTNRFYTSGGSVTSTSGANANMNTAYVDRCTTININVGDSVTHVISEMAGTVRGKMYITWPGQPSTIDITGGTGVVAIIKVYKLVKSHMLSNGYGLWKQFRFDNEAVDLSLGLGEFTGEEIMINGLTEVSPSSGVVVRLNGDSGNSYIRSAKGTNNYDNVDISSDFLTQCSAGSSTSVVKSWVYPSMKRASMIANYEHDGSQHTLHASGRYTGAGDATSIDISSSGQPYTGTISIYRL